MNLVSTGCEIIVYVLVIPQLFKHNNALVVNLLGIRAFI